MGQLLTTSRLREHALNQALSAVVRASSEVSSAVSCTPTSEARNMLTLAAGLIEEVYNAIQADDLNSDRLRKLHDALSGAQIEASGDAVSSPPAAQPIGPHKLLVGQRYGVTFHPAGNPRKNLKVNAVLLDAEKDSRGNPIAYRFSGRPHYGTFTIRFDDFIIVGDPT